MSSINPNSKSLLKSKTKRKNQNKAEESNKKQKSAKKSFYSDNDSDSLKEEQEQENQNIISDNNYNILLNLNPPESNVSNLDNLTLNSSMKGKYLEEDTQIIGEERNKNIHIQIL